MGATLSSDHVNYLIWRYLQERGYGRSAVQLMRDWNLEPEKLPFASTVKPHTLISILQDGLSFDELVSESIARDSAAQRPEPQTEPSEDSRRYSFVERRKRRASDSADDSRPELPRKRPRWHTNGSNQVSVESMNDVTTTRSGRRKSTPARLLVNGDTSAVEDFEPAVDDVKRASPDVDVEMQVEEPEPEIVSTLMVGQSIGIQTDIQIKPLANTVAEMKVPGACALHVAWSASTPAKLLVTGENLWRSWTVPIPATEDDKPPPLDYEDLAKKEKVSFVTATAAAPSGDLLALAVLSEISSEILLQPQTISKIVSDSDVAKDITLVADNRVPTFFPATSNEVAQLQWNPSSTRLLALAYDVGVTKLSTYDILTSTQQHDLSVGRLVALDMKWVSDDQFVVCGDKHISHYSVSPTLQHLHTLSTPETWWFVRWDPVTSLAIFIAPAEGRISLVEIPSPPPPPSPQPTTSDPADNSTTTTEPILSPKPPLLTIKHTILQSHTITAADWQPLPPTSDLNPNSTGKPRLFAVSSNDGLVTVYSASATTGLSCLHSFLMGTTHIDSHYVSLPALTMAFSPDGTFVAAAGGERVCVWRAAVEGKAVCVWEENEPALDARDYPFAAEGPAGVAAVVDQEEEKPDVHVQVVQVNGASAVEDTVMVNGEDVAIGILVNGDNSENAPIIETALPPPSSSQPLAESTTAPPPATETATTTTAAATEADSAPASAPAPAPAPAPILPSRADTEATPYDPQIHAVQHALAWHPNGSRLAFARGETTTVIDLDLPIEEG